MLHFDFVSVLIQITVSVSAMKFGLLVLVHSICFDLNYSRGILKADVPEAYFINCFYLIVEGGKFSDFELFEFLYCMDLFIKS